MLWAKAADAAKLSARTAENRQVNIDPHLWMWIEQNRPLDNTHRKSYEFPFAGIETHYTPAFSDAYLSLMLAKKMLAETSKLAGVMQSRCNAIDGCT